MCGQRAQCCRFNPETCFFFSVSAFYFGKIKTIYFYSNNYTACLNTLNIMILMSTGDIIIIIITLFLLSLLLEELLLGVLLLCFSLSLSLFICLYICLSDCLIHIQICQVSVSQRSDGNSVWMGSSLFQTLTVITEQRCESCSLVCVWLFYVVEGVRRDTVSSKVFSL